MITENQLKRAFNLQYELADYERAITTDVIKYIEHFNPNFTNINNISFSEDGDLTVNYWALELDRFEEHEEYNGYTILISKKYLLCEDKQQYLNNFKK